MAKGLERKIEHYSLPHQEEDVMTYEKALKEFDKLLTVNDDDLDGTIDHLVFRAQHELDLEDEGENEYISFVLPKGEYNKLTNFVKKWSGK